MPVVVSRQDPLNLTTMGAVEKDSSTAAARDLGVVFLVAVHHQIGDLEVLDMIASDYRKHSGGACVVADHRALLPTM